MRRLAALLAALQLWGASAWAYELGVGGLKEGMSAAPGQTSEYIYRVDSDEPLISVYLLGAVGRPGLYHVPTRMDLVSLLTLAGGTQTGAQTDRIVVKGQEASTTDRQIRFDLESAIQGKNTAKVPLMSNDLVYVTPGKPPITTDVLTAIGIVTGILGVVATSILVGQALKK